FPSRMLDSYIDSVLTGATSDGKVWGLPDTAGFHLLLFYNADLIQKPPDTETEMQALAQLLQGDDEAGLVVNSQDPIWLLPWVWAYGSWIVDDQGQAQLESEAMTKALSLYLQWHNSKPPVAPLLSHVEARDQFMNGQAALMIDGEWAIAELTQHNDISWKVAPLPDITDAERSPAPLILGRYWAINTDLPTKKAKTAITFLETVTAPQRQIEWLRVFGVLPTQRAALGGQINADNPALQISLQQLQNGQGVPLHTNLNAILDAMRTPLRQMLAGNLTPEEAATLMQDTFR
ncbi:MAG: extracellular solute-binding protein, partial [Chloroflexota bacterium]